MMVSSLGSFRYAFSIILLTSFVLTALFGCQQKPTDLPPGVVWKTNDTYQKANDYLDDGETDLGIEHLKEAAREGYRNPFLYLVLAKEFGRQRDYSTALRYNHVAREILESNAIEIMLPHEADMLKNNRDDVVCRLFSQHAALLYYAKDYKVANDYADKALSLCSENASALARDMKGRVAIELGRYDIAIDMFRFLTERSPSFSLGAFFLGKALVRSGKTDEGRIYLEQYIREAKEPSPFVDEAKQLMAPAPSDKKETSAGS